MIGLSIFIFSILILLALGQGVLVVGFVRAILRFRQSPGGPAYRPRAAIILCLRGRDPFLEKCIESLLKQDYPDYQLRIIVDRRVDPAWEVAESFAKQYGSTRVHVETLDERRETCSLKCSSVVQAVGRLDDSFAFAALVDADTAPHPTWLSELADSLADEQTGAATGNRWYMPEKSTWGAMVRYLWNAAAVVQMYWYEVAWGGTLAVKRDAIDRANLLGRWRHAFCEDTMLFRQLGKHGLRVAFSPKLMMVNREDSGIGACLAWIRRQLLTARLYHPRWRLVLLHGLGTTAVMATTVVMAAVAALCRDWPVFYWLAGGLAAYEAIMVSLLIPMELAVRRVVHARGESTAWVSIRTFLGLLPAIVLTQVVYTIALLGAQFARNVDWRGVSYRIDGAWHIHRLDDPPYVSDRPDAPVHSL